MTTESRAAQQLLAAMAKGVALVAGASHSGKRVASAVAGLASYSIDPPSVVASVPLELLPYLDTTFSVSLLASDQHELGRDLWEGPHDLERYDGSVGDDLLVEGALARLVCEPSLTTAVLDRGIVVGTVTAVSLGRGRPLLAGGLNSS